MLKLRLAKKKKVEEAVEDYLLYVQAKGLCLGTIKSRKADVRRLEAFLVRRGVGEVRGIRPRDLWAFFNELRSTPKARGEGGLLAASYIFRIFSNVRTFMNWCYRMEFIDEDIMLKVDPPQRDEQIKYGLTVEEVQRLVEAADNTYYPTRNRAIILVLVDTMLRVGELCRVRIERLEPTKYGGRTELLIKGRKKRTVFFSPKSWAAIQDLLRELGLDSGPLFLSRLGGPLTSAGVRQMIKRIAGLAGIKRTIYPHKLGRRTGANLRSERGASNKTIQQLGRWKSLSMVDLYVHHTESTLERLQAETSPLDDILGDS